MTAPGKELLRLLRSAIGTGLLVLIPATLAMVSVGAGRGWGRGLLCGLWLDLALLVNGYRKLRRALVVHTTTDAIYPGTDRPIQIGDRAWGPEGYMVTVQDLVVVTQPEDVADGVQSAWLRRHQLTYAGPPKSQNQEK